MDAFFFDDGLIIYVHDGTVIIFFKYDGTIRVNKNNFNKIKGKN